MKYFLLVISLMLFSELGFAKKFELSESNHILLRGEVSDSSVSKVINEITTSPSKELLIFIDSPGGSVTSGLRLMNVIENSGKDITCIASNAASMAFAILQSCKTRYVMDDSILMQHVMAYGVRGQEPNNYSLAQTLHKINVKMDKKQANRIGMSYESFRAKVRDDWWLHGTEAVAENVADDVAEVSCTEALSKKSTTVNIPAFGSFIQATFSGCPLAPGPIEANGAKSSTLSDEQIRLAMDEYLANNVMSYYIERRLRR